METVSTIIAKKFILAHLMIITEEFIIVKLDGFVAKIRDKLTNNEI